MLIDHFLELIVVKPLEAFFILLPIMIAYFFAIYYFNKKYIKKTKNSVANEPVIIMPTQASIAKSSQQIEEYLTKYAPNTNEPLAA